LEENAMGQKTPRDIAIEFIAAYDTEDAGAYEKHVVGVARKWLNLMASPETSQAMVDSVLEELGRPVPDDYGCAWADLKKHFRQWAEAEGWLKGNDKR
jgi:hypothetical protein